MREELTQLTGRRDGTAAEIEALEQRVGELTSAAGDAEAKLTRLRADAGTVQAEVTARQNALSEVENQLEQVRRAAAEAEAKVRGLEAETAQLQETATVAQGQLSKAQREEQAAASRSGPSSSSGESLIGSCGRRSPDWTSGIAS